MSVPQPASSAQSSAVVHRSHPQTAHPSPGDARPSRMLPKPWLALPSPRSRRAEDLHAPLPAPGALDNDHGGRPRGNNQGRCDRGPPPATDVLAGPTEAPASKQWISARTPFTSSSIPVRPSSTPWPKNGPRRLLLLSLVKTCHEPEQMPTALLPGLDAQPPAGGRTERSNDHLTPGSRSPGDGDERAGTWKGS